MEERGLWSDGYSLSASAIHTSLMHVQGVLSAAGKKKEAFPVLAILEYVRWIVCLVGVRNAMPDNPTECVQKNSAKLTRVTN